MSRLRLIFHDEYGSLRLRQNYELTVLNSDDHVLSQLKCVIDRCHIHRYSTFYKLRTSYICTCFLARCNLWVVFAQVSLQAPLVVSDY